MIYLCMHVYRTLRFNVHIHKDSLIIPILCGINPIPRADTYFFKIYSNIALPSTPKPSYSLFPACLRVKILKQPYFVSFLLYVPPISTRRWSKTHILINSDSVQYRYHSAGNETRTFSPCFSQMTCRNDYSKRLLLQMYLRDSLELDKHSRNIIPMKIMSLFISVELQECTMEEFCKFFHQIKQRK